MRNNIRIREIYLLFYKYPLCTNWMEQLRLYWNSKTIRKYGNKCVWFFILNFIYQITYKCVHFNILTIDKSISWTTIQFYFFPGYSFCLSFIWFVYLCFYSSVFDFFVFFFLLVSSLIFHLVLCQMKMPNKPNKFS